MLSDKMKAFIRLKGFKQKDLAALLEMNPPYLNQKIRNGSFKLTELIKIAEATNTRLAFIDDKGQPIITFELEDIEKA